MLNKFEFVTPTLCFDTPTLCLKKVPAFKFSAT